MGAARTPLKMRAKRIFPPFRILSPMNTHPPIGYHFRRSECAITPSRRERKWRIRIAGKYGPPTWGSGADTNKPDYFIGRSKLMAFTWRTCRRATLPSPTERVTAPFQSTHPATAYRRQSRLLVVHHCLWLLMSVNDFRHVKAKPAKIPAGGVTG